MFLILIAAYSILYSAIHSAIELLCVGLGFLPKAKQMFAVEIPSTSPVPC